MSHCLYWLDLSEARFCSTSHCFYCRHNVLIKSHHKSQDVHESVFYLSTSSDPNLFPGPDSLLPSRSHLSQHPAIRHLSDQLLPHFRPPAPQHSHSKAAPTETHPGLSWHLKLQTCISSFIPLKPWNVPSTTSCPPVSHKMNSLTQISPASGPLIPLRRASSQWLSCSVPPEPRPTRQSSYSSTYLLCLTVNHQILLSSVAEHRWLSSNLANLTFQVT